MFSVRLDVIFFFVSNVDEVYFRSYIKNTALRNTHTRFPGH